MTSPSLPEGARCATHPYVDAVYLCARCGSFLCGECAVIATDAESYCTGCETELPGPIPWEQRARVGRLRAFGRTALAILLAPGTFFRLEPRDKSIWPTVLFGYLFTLTVDTVDLVRAVVVWQTDPMSRSAFVSGFRRGAQHLPELWDYADAAWALAEFGGPIGSPLWYAVWIGVSAAGWWLGLRLVAGRVPYREIVRALSYTNVLAGFGLLTMWLSGPAVLFFTVVLAVWGSILQILAMSRLAGHEIGRAIGAFFVMLLLLTLGSVAACAVPAFVLSMAHL